MIALFALVTMPALSWESCSREIRGVWPDRDGVIVGFADRSLMISSRGSHAVAHRVAPSKFRAAPVASSGTHATAIATDSAGRRWLAVYGDGLLRKTGDRWTRVPDQPESAREATALCFSAGSLWLGTRRSGLFRYGGGEWRPLTLPGDLPAPNVVRLYADGENLWGATLSDGVIRRSRSGWAAMPSLDARQFARIEGRIFILLADGRLVGEDGKELARLPRGQGFCLAQDRDVLFVGGWGGWSELQKGVWRHHYREAALQGVPVTCMMPTKDALWIGTQGRGSFRFEAGKLGSAGDPLTLGDDWVTCLSSDAGGRIYAGTFVGGLSEWRAGNWRSVPGFERENVTAIQPVGNSVWIATRRVVRSLDGCRLPIADAQSLAFWQSQLWVGTRTNVARFSARG